MPVNQFLLWISDIVIILGNMYLYMFLQRNTDRRQKGDMCTGVRSYLQGDHINCYKNIC